MTATVVTALEPAGIPGRQEPPCALLTVPETAKTLRTCRATVYNLMERGQLRWVQVAGKRRISAAEIERFIAANTEQASA